LRQLGFLVLEIRNRFLGVAFAADNFIVGMTDVSPVVRAPTLWNYDVCGQYPGAVPLAATVFLPCKCNMAAHRYAVLQFPINEHAHVCELEVFVRSEYCYFAR